MISFTESLISFLGSPAFHYSCLGASAIGLMGLALWRWRMYHTTLKALQTESQDVADAQQPLPKVSIVIPAYNEAAALEANLPRILRQEYNGQMEVIVVDENSTDDTASLIERLQQDHHNLRSTFIPSSARNIEYRKLALTLGIRASRAEWVVVMNADCEPLSTTWLAHLASRFTDDVDFVAAYINHDFDHTASTRRSMFDRMLRQMQRYAAWRSGTVTGSETANYAVRKSAFLSHQGFADSLCLPFGEECIYASHQVDPQRSVWLTGTGTAVCDAAPSAHYAQTLRIISSETDRHLTPQARRHAWQGRLSILCAQLMLWSTIIYTGIRLDHDCTLGLYSLTALPTDIGMLFLALTALITPLCYMHRISALLQAPDFGWNLVGHSLLAPLRSLHIALLRYAHRAEFVRSYMVKEE